MLHKFRLKLFFVLLIFAIIVSFTIATVDYFRIKEQAIHNNNFQINQAEETAIYSLKTIDKAFSLLDQETAKKMEDVTFLLQEKYEKNADFKKWDFDKLAKSFGMDIYIIDESSEIIESNVAADVGMVFSDCCGTLHKVLEKRRDSGQLYIDEIDIEQQTGDVKKFSYMATPDKKYIIELGYALKDEAVFEEFNFLNIIEDIETDFDTIDKMNVYSFGGIPFGEDQDKTSPRRKQAVREARDSHETIELKADYQGNPAVYRYVPYVSDYDTNDTQTKILEIIYTQNELTAALKEKKQLFYLQLGIIIIVTLVVAFIISRWFAKPIHLAFHDNLTGLKNRAAFVRDFPAHVMKRNNSPILFMMDLDNFKLVNDFYGHDRGDLLLQRIATTITNSVDNDHVVYHLGGDGFIVFIPNGTKEQAEMTAQLIIDNVQQEVTTDEFAKADVSISIGITIVQEDQRLKSIYKNVDNALYKAKENGKNNYYISSIPYSETSASIK